MEVNENILDLEKPVNETEDYNDFVTRMKGAKKSIRTKVTTLMENGEVHSEVMGTTVSEEQLKSNTSVNAENVNEQKSSADGSNNDENISNFQNTIDDGNAINSNNAEPSKKDNIEPNTKKDNSTESKKSDDENRTILGMKPIYGYSLITIIALVGITAAVKIFKNNTSKKISLT